VSADLATKIQLGLQEFAKVREQISPLIAKPSESEVGVMEIERQMPKYELAATTPIGPSDQQRVHTRPSGWLKGGVARAAKLGPRKRSQTAATAAKARWGKER
jgi:hypothetical protein